MLGNNFFLRIFTAYAAVVLLVSLIISIAAGRYIEENLRDNAMQDLHVQAELLSSAVRLMLRNGASQAQLGELLKPDAKSNSTAENKKNRHTLVSAQGGVIADTHAPRSNMENHALRPEIFRAQDEGYGYSERFSATMQEPMLYYAVRVEEPGFQPLYVRTSTSLRLLEQSVYSSRFLILIVTGFSALLALLLGIYVLRRFTTELDRISEQADEISRGNYNKRIYTARPHELGQLAMAINRLAKSAQKRLSEVSGERNRLAVILSSMAEGVIALDHNQRVLHINDAAGRLLDINPARTLGRPLWEQVRHPQIQEIVEYVFETRLEASGELRISRDGGEIIADLYATSFLSSVGQKAEHDFIGVVLVIHDKSVQRQLETIRRDFVANASHELKTPIAAIRGLAETLAEDEDMPKKMRKSFIKKINRQTQRLSILVNELMDLSRFETRSDRKPPEEFDLCALCRQSLSDVQPLAQQKGLRLGFSTNIEQLPFVADKMAIEQMLLNLLNNAIKYTEEGDVQLLLSAKQDSIEIIVKDTGEGISAMDQTRIFERFYRVDKARSRELGGNGLGLSIVKHIVDAHGGKIGLESQLDQGSRFTVVFKRPQTQIYESPVDNTI